MSKSKTPRTALANILDKVSSLGSLEGGDVITSVEAEQRSTPSRPVEPVSLAPVDAKTEIVLSVDPFKIRNWSYNDRPDNELGDITAFANELKTLGQQQPCIVRPCHDDSTYLYEVIAGERRWRAAKEANIALKVIVKPLTDREAALCQASENSQRKDLSDYAKGLSFYQMIERGIVSRQELQDNFNKSKSFVRNLLSFGRIPAEIVNAIGDLSKLSAATAYEITRLLEKGPQYHQAILELAHRLSGKNISDKKLQHLVIAQMGKHKETLSAIEIKAKDGRHLFTWRKDTNGNRSIAFPKDIRDIIDFSALEKILVASLEQQIKTLNKGD